MSIRHRVANLSDPTPRSVALTASSRAAALLRRGLGRTTRIDFKGEIDLVTEYDRRSEELIVATIRAAFPDHQIVAEEGTGRGQASPHVWLVDPLDGTGNFAHGYPVFAVSVAYEREGQLEVGVVVDPSRRDVFVAERGRGATLNGQPIHVSRVDTLKRSLLATGFPYDHRNVELALERFNRGIRAAQGVRRAGSAALDLCHVAAGRFDGYWEEWLGPWDYAAGALVVAEAGGSVTSLDGSPFDARSGRVLATNGLIHTQLVELLASTS